jgi:hypothetical protein
MEKHAAKIAVNGIATLYVVSAIAAGAFALMLWGGSALFGFMEPSFLQRIGSGIALIAAVVFAALAVLDLIIGIGLYTEQEWARKLALVLAAFNLFSFPFGTITSILTIGVLGFSDDVKRLFLE